MNDAAILFADATWIGRDGAGPDEIERFRRDVRLGAPTTGGVRATARGRYRYYVNGTSVTAGAVVPRWTPFEHDLEYQEFEVAVHLRPGRNIPGRIVGNGRYGACNSLAGRGPCSATLSAMLVVETQDGPGSRGVWFTDQH